MTDPNTASNENAQSQDPTTPSANRSGGASPSPSILSQPAAAPAAASSATPDSGDQPVPEETLLAEIRALTAAAKEASAVISAASTKKKNAVLARVADKLLGSGRETILAANAADMAEAERTHLRGAMVDRLRLDEDRLAGVAEGVRQVMALPDPVGSIEETRRLPSGLEVGRMRVPLGVIGIIYESRPNVTADAAALCLKSGNAVVLRGGKEAKHSNAAIAAVFAEALAEEWLPAAVVSPIPTTDRRATRMLAGMEGLLDLIIPRGGEGLIRFVNEHARVPVIQHYKGNCHVFVDAAADLDKAFAIAMNAKVQRPGVCNAMETLLVDRAVAEAFLPKLGAALQDAKVELRGDETTRGLVSGTKPALAEDWDTEYADYILAVKVVDGLDEAMAHVRRHGSLHTEAIVTEDYSRARRWVREVDASMVVVNASTRFNDGFQLGLGAELGISTTKLHAYGPMGLEELCTRKWVAFGEGQVRE